MINEKQNSDHRKVGSGSSFTTYVLGEFMVRVVLPYHLRTLARLGSDEVLLEVNGPVTQRSVLDALEAPANPMLCGTVRDHVTQRRRAFLRFFACEQDLSHELPDSPLPEGVASGAEPYLIIAAVAGG